MTEATETPALSGELMPAADAHDKSVDRALASDRGLTPAEYEKLTQTPEAAQNVLSDIRMAHHDASRAVALLCKLLCRSRTFWPAGGPGDWAWRQTIETECGISASLAAKMAGAWDTVMRYPAWREALRETAAAWDLEGLTRTANILDSKDPDGQLADDEALASAFSCPKRPLRQRRLYDRLLEWEAHRRREADDEFALEPPPNGPQSQQNSVDKSLFTVSIFEREVKTFLAAVQVARLNKPHDGPLRDRLALAVDRAAGGLDGLADALAAEDF